MWRIALVFGALLGADAILLTIEWPFTRQAVIRSLEEAASAPVEIRQFRSVYFPRPGCVAEGVVIHHTGRSPNPPLVTIAKFTVIGGYWRLFGLSKTLNLIHTEGMHVRIRAGGPSQPSGGNGQLGSSFSTETLTADDTVIDFASQQAGQPPFRILAKRTRLAPVSGRRAVNFETDLRLPTPPSDVHSEGRFGPWNQRDPFATNVSGSFTLRHGDLSFTGGIAGMLESRGTYHGQLRQLDVTGSAVVPDFRVASANHPAGLTARYVATVNGQTGETVLHDISVQFGRTSVNGAGTVASQSPGNKNLTTLALAVPRGRIEDVLYLLTQSSPGMKGDLTLHTSVALPDNMEPFLKKLRMQGDFQITKALFTELSTEHALERIRDRSRHEPPDYAKAALGKVEGRAVVSGGVARLSNIEFQDPGASARVAGTFNLLSERTDLRGTAHLDTSIASAARGLKGFLLKVLSPFFKSRKRQGSTVPIKITGSYGNTSLSIDTSAKQ